MKGEHDMKKSKKMTILFAVMLFILCSSIIAHGQNGNSKFNPAKWGESLKKDASAAKSKSDPYAETDIYARGEHTVILKSDIDRASAFYEAKGLSQDEARKEAVNYVEEYESLYHEAIENGYSASESEAEKYISEMKATYKSTEMDEVSKKMLDEMIQKFDSENDYWDYERIIYMKQLPIQKYVQDLEAEYFGNNPQAGDEEWLAYFEKHKKALVSKEKFKKNGNMI